MELGSDQMIIGALIGVIAGVLLGYLIGRRSAPGIKQAQQLEEQLETAIEEKRHFEERVTEHFAESAEKLNRLTEQYREVHHHLAAGAAALASDSAGSAFRALEAPAVEEEPPAIESDAIVVEPPRDYAPKTSPEEPGVLNERFGLENDVPAESAGERREA